MPAVTDRLPTRLFLLRRRSVSALVAWKSQLTRPFCVRPRSVAELVRLPYHYSILIYTPSAAIPWMPAVTEPQHHDPPASSQAMGTLILGTLVPRLWQRHQ